LERVVTSYFSGEVREFQVSSFKTKMKLLKHLSTLLILLAAATSQTQAPDRVVKGNRLFSGHDPKVSIELPKSAHYVGADRWILYGIADCELHAFVEADAQKHVRKLYWVQFEGYIPSKPTLQHQYDSPRHTEMGGMDFYVDTWTRDDGEPTQAGSDREHIEALVHAHGYKMPVGMMYVRLVHLLDERKRKELMIIYGEDLLPTGFSAADLKENGKALEKWPSIEAGLLERAKKSLPLKP
jgi:hypothetical protein